MSERKAYRCDGPGCDVILPGRGDFGLLPEGWYQLETYEHSRHTWHFHDATCLRQYAEHLAPVAVEAGE